MKKRVVAVLLTLVSATVVVTSFTGCGRFLNAVKDVVEEELLEDESEENGVNSEASNINTDTGEEEKVEANDVYNNDHFFVQSGDLVYFRAPSAGSMVESSIFGEFLTSDLGDTAIMTYNVNTGETSEFVQTNGYGTISIVGNYVYGQDREENAGEMEYQVSRYALSDGSKEVLLKDGFYLGADKAGKAVSYYKYEVSNYGGYYIKLYATTYDDYTNSIDVDNFSDYVGITDNCVYYVAESYDTENSAKQLYEWNFITDELTCVGYLTLPVDEYLDPYGITEKFQYDSENIYFAYGFYEGTGHFYADGYYIKVKRGVQDSITSKSIPVYGDECFETRPYKIVNGEMEACTKMPGEANREGAANAFAYYLADENGDEQCQVSVNYETSENGLEVEIIEYVNGLFFEIDNATERMPEDDIGWREAYVRTKTSVFVVNPESEERTAIYSISGK